MQYHPRTVCRLFRQISDTQRIDFKSFVFTLWTYLTLNRTMMEEFIFRMYDDKKRNSIGIDTLVLIMKEVHGEEQLDKNEQTKM